MDLDNGVFENVRAQLNALSESEVDEILVANGYDPVQLRDAEA
ncbi:hypothetical protein [Corynebacterium jeddahense]|nr:hypothetical protein [Corynebacterium jeddahense]